MTAGNSTMAKGILGRKVGMTQVYDDRGQIVPVTVIQAGPCQVLQLRTLERDGYQAVQLGYLDKPRRLARRSERGHVAKLASKRARKLATAGVEIPGKADCEPKRYVRELRGETGGFSLGQVVKVDVLTDVSAVDVIGTSKGRGYTGVMKRHGFAGQRATHGVKKVHRHAGGTGCSADPSRVFKGTRMAGQYGAERVTARNLKVIKVDAENNLLVVRGAIPGPNGGFVIVQESNKVS
jgi:large subunit ribosomal protein L3